MIKNLRRIAITFPAFMTYALYMSFLILLLVLSNNCTAQGLRNPTIVSTQVNVRSLIDSLTYSINKHYIFPEKALGISRYLKKQFMEGVYDKITDPDKLAYKLITDIRKVNYDSHLNVFYTPKKPQPTQNIKEFEEDIQQHENFEKESNFNFKKVEILSGNVGYLLFNGFTGNIAEARPTLNASLTFLKNAKAIIIDLRYNGGGSPEMVNQVESYFFEEKVHMVDFLTTFDKDTISLYTDPTSTNGLSLSMPVYLLTSKNTFSGAEDFSYAMQTTKRATVVGDTTGGGAHAAMPFSIGQGFMARIPFSRPINPFTLTNWEGVGVVPNISIAAFEALTKAREVIYQNLLTKSKTEKDKRIIQWAINELISETNSPTLTIPTLEKYVGTFTGGLNFFIENGSLFCKNPERGGTDIFKLNPVRDNVFLLDENAQVEFVKDAQNNYSSLKLMWVDGNVTKKHRL